MADALAEPVVPVAWTVDGLHVSGGNTLLAAQWKAGKTTLGINLVRSLADGEPFLGRFDVRPPARRIGYWNYEVGGDQFNAWMRVAEIRNAERVADPWHLRGSRLPLMTDVGETHAVRWLVENDIDVLIVDPLTRVLAHSGLLENSNDDVGRLLDTLDYIKQRAGVTDLFLLHHYGKGGEVARGASVILGWPDALWNLERKGEDRFFHAEGRDVDVEEAQVRFVRDSLRLTLTPGNRQDVTRLNGVRSAASVVAANPGIKKSDLIDKMTGDKTHRGAYINEAVAAGYIAVEDGRGNSKLHTITDAGEKYLAE